MEGKIILLILVALILAVVFGLESFFKWKKRQMTVQRLKKIQKIVECMQANDFEHALILMQRLNDEKKK
jgi:sensor domain CHASE-containing protein